ncbi:hypothetical protein PM082_018648 [Marasmius tenuissimus]|nr:hypothetical protein PM082_018648 [Marasmius tenuissimus]
MVEPFQPVAFTWIRDLGDLGRFGFQKNRIGRPSKTFLVEAADRGSGVFTLTFKNTVSFTIVAIDLDETLSGSTFFTAPSPIFVVPTRVTSQETNRETGTLVTNTSPVTTTSLSPTPNPDGLPETTRTTSTETSAPPTSTTPHESKTTMPRVVGCAIVGGVLGLALLLLIVMLIHYRGFRVALTRKFRSHQHQQCFNITALPISTPHVTPSSSLAERKLLRNAGKNQIAQSLLPVAQKRNVPNPQSPPTLQLRDHTEDTECSRELPHLQADGTAADRNDLDKGMERVVQVLQSRFDVMAQRVAQLESELADHLPPDYTSLYRGPSHLNWAVLC